MPCNARRHVSKALIALTVGFPLAGMAHGQQQQIRVGEQVPAMQRGGLNPDSFYGKETFQGVAVKDSLEAIKKLEDARDRKSVV